ITVTLDTPNPYADVSVLYTTINGTANAGSDYTTASGSLTVPVGQTSVTFTVPILDDAIAENTKTVLLQLASPTGATLGTTADATLTIFDDDGPPPAVNSNPTSLQIS